MFNSLKKIPAYIYDLIISNFLTVTSHIIMINYLIFKPTDQNLLDVGCGTGKPLKSILKNIPQSINIVGVDIDKSYVAACK
jgi:ubiquinone/menaquinone biosynthesis C-methylase UbiE